MQTGEGGKGLDNKGLGNDQGKSATPNVGFARLIRAWGYSMKGLKAAWRDEAAFRQEVVGIVRENCRVFQGNSGRSL